MQATKNIVIIAGEESGDLHAAKLITQLKAQYPRIKISGIGGHHMHQAGAKLIAELAQYGVTGLSEVIRHFKIIRRAFLDIKHHLKENKPDLLLLVDYPGFNLRLAKYAKKELGIKIIYYISPQVWAWKAKRIRLIKQYIDHMAVILPFEKQIYEKAGIPVSFVGHPLIDKMAKVEKEMGVLRQQLHLPLKKDIIALLPGSRTHEIEQHMPILVSTMQMLLQHSINFHFIIPIAQTINKEKIASYFDHHTLPITLIDNQAIECMAAANFVIVASGTASLECALLTKPMCIIYRSSLLTYVAATQLLKIKFLGLCNILTNKMMVPEFLHYDCNSNELSKYIINFYNNSQQPQRMIKQLSHLQESLSPHSSDCSLFELIEKELF